MNENSSEQPTRFVPQESDPQAVAKRVAEQRSDPRPKQIGPFRILETLGEGGMGVVYLAEQEKPFHRRVALKIIKLGMDTKQVIARFETEREALALMNHPNVAKVFDAGTTETGRPYFVMEHVPGLPITDYCDKHRLNTEERLRLFMRVCHAIQHAHQKGIIHRDIKPSNILITVDPSAPPLAKGGLGGVQVKVIDFGVAKATQQRLTQRTLFTEQGQLIGTPEYMSPEQAEMTALDVDTRTDIYSLGVLLYELLVGERPFDERLLRQAGYSELQRIIREVDPPKPSTRLSAIQSEPRASASGAMPLKAVEAPLPHGRGSEMRSHGSIDDIAKLRRTDARTLIRQIRGDLDWIVMKCLEKDRTRRYDTANGLTVDLQRCLNHEPVLAGPPSRAYRVRKFVRRNRGAVMGALSVSAVLVLGIIGTSTGLAWALRERGRAWAAEQQQVREREQAEQARDEAEAVTQFLTDTLSSVNPDKQGKDVTVREVLDRAAEAIGEKFGDKPLIEARLRQAVGWSYLGLGLYDRAEGHLADGAAIYRRILGEQHRRTLSAVNNLAACLQSSGKYAASEIAFRTTLEIQRRALGDEHPDTLASLNNLAIALDGQSRYAEAEELHRKTLEVSHRVLGEEHPRTLKSMHNLAMALSGQGRDAEAEKLYGETLRIQRQVLGDEHVDTLLTMHDLGIALWKQRRFAEAEDLNRKTLEARNRILGPQHPDTLRSMASLANAMGAQDRFAEAEQLYRETLELQRRVFGDGHPDVAVSLFNAGSFLEKQRRYQEAETLARQARAIWERRLPSERRYLRVVDTLLGGALTGQQRFADAETLLITSYKALGDDPDVVPHERNESLDRLTRLYEAWDAAEPGRGYAERAAEWRSKLQALENPRMNDVTPTATDDQAE